MDESLLAGIFGAIAGGVVAAFIGARANLRLVREASWERASKALWDYQRTLAGFAAKQWDEAGVYDEHAVIGTAQYTDVRAAYVAAYPWAGYLSPEVRAKVLRTASIEIGYPPHGSYDSAVTAAQSADVLANLLEKELDRTFPLHPPRRWAPLRLRPRRKER